MYPHKLPPHHLFRASEWAVIAAGIFLLAGIAFIAVTGDFTVWLAAKLVFAVGLLLFIFDR